MDAVSTLPLEASAPETWVHWFAPYGCVVERGAMCEVLVGGTLIGQYEREGRDRGARNVLLVTLARDAKMHLGHMAAAFGVSEEYLRILRRKAESGGLRAVLLTRTGGKERITARQRARLHRRGDRSLQPRRGRRRGVRRRRRRQPPRRRPLAWSQPTRITCAALRDAAPHRSATCRLEPRAIAPGSENATQGASAGSSWSSRSSGGPSTPSL